MWCPAPGPGLGQLKALRSRIHAAEYRPVIKPNIALIVIVNVDHTMTGTKA